LQGIEKEVLQLLKKGGSMSASQMAAALKLSEKATLSVICRMAQQGTIDITGVQSTT
jgi:DNA-binding Lrp family transcriptional regulator